MTVARDQHTDNIVLGAGEIYVDRLDATNGLTGERYLGDSINGTLSVTSERTTIQSGDGQVAQDLVDIVRSVTRTMGFTLHDMSVENWALFMVGQADSQTVAVAEAAASVNGGNAVVAGRSYQINQSPTNPSGIGPLKNDVLPFAAVGSIAAAELEPYTGEVPSGGVPNAVEREVGGSKQKVSQRYGTSNSSSDTLIVVDYLSGRITVENVQPKTVITFPKALPAKVERDAAGDASKVTLSAVEDNARDVKQAVANKDSNQIRCALRYIETAAAGKSRNIYIRKCTLVPGGEMSLKSRDTEQQMQFTATVVEPPDGYPHVVIDNNPLIIPATAR